MRLDDPIFIVGVQHSGTTILKRMLARHPDLAWFSQYSLRRGEVPGRRFVPGGALINRAVRQFLPVPWDKQDTRLSRLIPTPHDSRCWLDWMPKHKVFFEACDATPDLAASAQAMVARECLAWRKSRLLEKAPELTRAILLLREIFPRAKFVHIIRDGRAVAPSIADKFAGTPLGPADSLAMAAEYWRDAIAYVERCQEAYPDSILTVKYENLCEHVPATLGEILDFCELSSEVFHLHQLPERLTATNERHFEASSVADRELIDSILGDSLARAGYVPSNSVRLMSPVAKRRPDSGATPALNVAPRSCRN